MSNTIVLHALTRIYNDRGELTPAAVVEEAADINHPLHSQFEWDDAEAARKHRLNQAADLIRSVRIRVSEPDLAQVRGFLHIPSEDNSPGRYVPNEVVARDPMLRAIVLRQMDRDWKALRRRYQEHSEFWSTVASDVSEHQADTG